MKYFLFTVIAFFLPAIALAQTVPAPVSYTSATMPSCPEGYVCTPLPTATSTAAEKVYYMSYSLLSDAINDVETHLQPGDILAPQMYTVTGDLTATGSIRADIKTVAASRGVKIMPLIVNANFDQDLMHTFLSSDTAEDNVIAYLIEEALSQGYIGWQFDFEHMMASDRQAYSDFVHKAATALHNQNLILSVAVVARSSDASTTPGYLNWGGVYDYPALAQSADFLSLMTYDDPNSIGPTASLPYDKQILSHILSQVPPQKISLGIPFYYYGWDLSAAIGDNRAVMVPTATAGDIVRHGGTFFRWQDVKNMYGTQELFDSGLGVPYATYYLDGHRYQIWYEDGTSIGLKLDLLKSLGLRGISAWALGQEFPTVWPTLTSFK